VRRRGAQSLGHLQGSWGSHGGVFRELALDVHSMAGRGRSWECSFHAIRRLVPARAVDHAARPMGRRAPSTSPHGVTTGSKSGSGAPAARSPASHQAAPTR
jgi:hypothetical protein